MSASTEEIAQLRAYIRANRDLVGWITGARGLALLRGAVECGVLDALATRSTARQIADVTSTDEKSIVDL